MRLNLLFAAGMLTCITLVLCISAVENKAAAQRGLEVEKDTLTDRVLIHPPINTDEEGLISSEHDYRKQ